VRCRIKGSEAVWKVKSAAMIVKSMTLINKSKALIDKSKAMIRIFRILLLPLTSSKVFSFDNIETKRSFYFVLFSLFRTFVV